MSRQPKSLHFHLGMSTQGKADLAEILSDGQFQPCGFGDLGLPFGDEARHLMFENDG